MSDNIMGYNAAGESMMREGSGGCKTCSQSGGKRKLTPYTSFVKKQFPELKKKNPGLKATQIMKMIAKMWKETPRKSPSASKPKTVPKKSKKTVKKTISRK
jgi:hypothetical protein